MPCLGPAEADRSVRSHADVCAVSCQRVHARWHIYRQHRAAQRVDRFNICSHPGRQSALAHSDTDQGIHRSIKAKAFRQFSFYAYPQLPGAPRVGARRMRCWVFPHDDQRFSAAHSNDAGGRQTIPAVIALAAEKNSPLAMKAGHLFQFIRHALGGLLHQIKLIDTVFKGGLFNQAHLPRGNDLLHDHSPSKTQKAPAMPCSWLRLR